MIDMTQGDRLENGDREEVIPPHRRSKKDAFYPKNPRQEGHGPLHNVNDETVSDGTKKTRFRLVSRARTSQWEGQPSEKNVET